mmetsp:Transcript_32119/g.83221  ORF Transcript_32119/g.83221 Transcript_32119/m.83221 type:complete len:204 (+) Transcript_32119:2857-3468(+)
MQASGLLCKLPKRGADGLVDVAQQQHRVAGAARAGLFLPSAAADGRGAAAAGLCWRLLPGGWGSLGGRCCGWIAQRLEPLGEQLAEQLVLDGAADLHKQVLLLGSGNVGLEPAEHALHRGKRNGAQELRHQLCLLHVRKVREQQREQLLLLLGQVLAHRGVDLLHLLQQVPNGRSAVRLALCERCSQQLCELLKEVLLVLVLH